MSEAVNGIKRKYLSGYFVVVVVAVIGIIVSVIVGIILSTSFHLRHEWAEATCTEPRTCIVSGETEGRAPGHTRVEATCLVPETCVRCGTTEGGIGVHQYDSEYRCIYCGELGAIELTQDNYADYLLITYSGCKIYFEPKGSYEFIDCTIQGICSYYWKEQPHLKGTLSWPCKDLESDGNDYRNISGAYIITNITEVFGYVTID